VKRVSFCIAVLLLFRGSYLDAQDLKIPQPSTFQRIEQDLGLGQVIIAYSRPNVKDREIFGFVEPYGHVWRTGANAATKMKLTDTMIMEKQVVLPGEYGLFTIPGLKFWTIILNRVSQQWGAYSYDSTKDVLRFTVPSQKLKKKVETFTIQFANSFVEHTELQLTWETTLVSIHLETDIDSRVMANIEKDMQGDKKPYYFAAIYYYNHGKDLTKALSWIQEADSKSPNAYNIKYWKARIELKNGDREGAIATASEGLKLAKAEPNLEYIRLNNEVLSEAARKNTGK
jgi:hypothetical protein